MREHVKRAHCIGSCEHGGERREMRVAPIECCGTLRAVYTVYLYNVCTLSQDTKEPLIIINGLLGWKALSSRRRMPAWAQCSRARVGRESGLGCCGHGCEVPSHPGTNQYMDIDMYVVHVLRSTRSCRGSLRKLNFSEEIRKM